MTKGASGSTNQPFNFEKENKFLKMTISELRNKMEQMEIIAPIQVAPMEMAVDILTLAVMVLALAVVSIQMVKVKVMIMAMWISQSTKNSPNLLPNGIRKQ